MGVASTAANAPALADALTIVRLALHVLAASVWVGGQLVVAGLLPTIRGLGVDATRSVARAFARLSWPAYWVLIATGIWNYAAVSPAHATFSWKAVFAVKMAAVVLAGLGAFLHTRARTAAARGAFAGVAALASTAALVLGVALAG